MITEISNISELPSIPLQGYVILKGQTIEDVYAEYEKKFKVKPTVGWQYKNLIYLVKPEREEK